MSVRNLASLFAPRSIALIGASERPNSVGAVVAHNLFHAGFAGPVMPVNPKHRSVEGVLAYPDEASLPMTPDLAVICTPARTVPGIISALGRRGTKSAVVITAGFGEGDDRVGNDLRQAALDAARPHLLRIVGPNCLGLLVPGINLNASFSHLSPLRGNLAFVAQSGAMVTSVLDWAASRGIGFSHVVSLGDMIDVDIGDMLDYLASDAATRAILLYVEGVTHARKFMSAARVAARGKPVIVVKSGRHAESAKAVASHTGAITGSDEVCDAAFRRAGMLRVLELDELFDAVETLALCGPARGDRLAILTNGGGVGVMATDSLLDRGGHLAALSASTIERLDKVLPSTWSHGNPVDIGGEATPECYRAALTALFEDKDVDAVLALNCPTAIASSTDAAKAVIEAAGPRKCNLFTSWIGDAAIAEAMHLFAQARIPAYATPDHAVRAFMYMVRHWRNQDMLVQVPPSTPEDFAPDTEKARATIDAALEAGREWLTEPEAKEILLAYRVPAQPTRVARTAEDAALLAKAFDAPCALKIVSPDITHKTDAGGVALGLPTPQAVREAAEAMMARIGAAFPRARIDGFAIEPMFDNAGGHELIVGMTEDDQFGPVILFGQGGVAADVIADKALALAPLNMTLAHSLIARTRVYRLLQGYRKRPPAALDAIALTLVKISQLVVDFAEIAELDINPLVADAQGVTALDARIRVKRFHGDPQARLAIRPYPTALEETVALRDGRSFLMRPVRPEDAPALVSAFEKLSPEDVRFRFFAPKKELSADMTARLTQIDYDREMALVLSERSVPPGRAEIYGVVRIVADPNNEEAEYAIVVRTDMKGQGLGYFLMHKIIAYARARGIKRLIGDVLRENEAMLKMCREFGFAIHAVPEEGDIFRVELGL